MKDFDLNIFFDTDLARRDFEESFEHSKEYRGLGNDLYVYIDCGNLPSKWEPELIATKKQVIDAVKSFDYFNFLGMRINVESLLKDYEVNTKSKKSEWIDFLYQQADFKVLFDAAPELCNFTILATRGYSQGDYAEIVVPYELIKVCYGEKEYKAFCKLPYHEKHDKIETLYQKTINNLFWDCPLHARLTIGENEYYLEEYIKDLYDYDKEEMKEEIIAATKGKIEADLLEAILEALPEYPDYL